MLEYIGLRLYFTYLVVLVSKRYILSVLLILTGLARNAIVIYFSFSFVVVNFHYVLG